MKIFLSGLDASLSRGEYVVNNAPEMNYNLMSYYYINYGKKKGQELFNKTLERSKEMIIDSGAFTFIHGKKANNINWLKYTLDYANWILKNDNNKIVGFFEMDIDCVIGYEKVLELRKILMQATNKIMPVWHKNRGIEEFKNMCKEFDYVAMPGRKNCDAKDKDLIKFVNYAHSQNAKIHGLALTREKILNEVPFDSVDSASWAIQQANNHIQEFKNKETGKFPTRKYAKENHFNMALYSYMKYVKMQNKYKEMWQANERK